MPALIDAFRADATIGEVSDVLIAQFGSFNTARKGRSFQESASA